MFEHVSVSMWLIVLLNQLSIKDLVSRDPTNGLILGNNFLHRQGLFLKGARRVVWLWVAAPSNYSNI